MMEPRSPCLKPECIKKDKTICSKDCKKLAAYQTYLQQAHDPYTSPAIDAPTGDYSAGRVDIENYANIDSYQ